MFRERNSRCGSRSSGTMWSQDRNIPIQKPISQKVEKTTMPTSTTPSSNGEPMPFPFANRGPLEGLVVLDFTTHLSGPLTTYFLAGMGATVIKIEETKGDSVRGYAPFVGPDGELTMWREHPDAMSLPILNRARGKHSITLNLKSPQAKDIYRDLAKRADIVVENYASGTADRLGIGYEATRAINARIIYCSISGFGNGALPGRKALDAVVQAMSGIMMASGVEGDPPVRVGMSIADSIAPLFAVMGITAALHGRDRTGEGEYVDISMLGSLTALLAAGDWRAMERIGRQTRTGNFNHKSTPFGVYRCLDGFISIGAGTKDTATHALFRIMGRPELAQDERYATIAARTQRDDEVNQIVEEWTGRNSMEDIEQKLLQAGIPVGRVRTPADAADDPLLSDRREITGVLHPDLGLLPGLKAMGMPTRFHRAKYGHGAPAPKLGQHNEQIYRWLGITKPQFADLKAAGVI
jgi:CoA:oxalate CoA-transferase